MNKVFNILDVPRFARPCLSEIDVIQTAQELRIRLQTTGWMSYNPLWPRINFVKGKVVSEDVIKTWWKSESLIEAMMILKDEFAQSDPWYGFTENLRDISGILFKPTVKGIRVRPERFEALVINPRKGQPIDDYDARFLARAAYEEHCIDDPNNPEPVIIDLSKPKFSKVRLRRRFTNMRERMISIEEFEQILGTFFEAAQIAGYEIPYVPGSFSADLFRRRR